jgi:Holliday junction DNA helicase RuvB
MDNRVVSSKAQAAESAYERTLSPKRLDEFIGQDKVKENLRIMLSAANTRGEALDHILFYGLEGFGKSTLAEIISNEMGVTIKTTTAGAIARPGDLAMMLTNLRANDVLSIVELQHLARQVEDVLRQAMENGVLDIMIGKGPTTRSIRLKLPRFSIVGTTTNYGLISQRLRDDFGATYRLDFYDLPAMQMIVARSAGILGVSIDTEGVREIARRARGTPRVANRLLKQVRDFAEVRAEGIITADVARHALSLLELDQLGLDDLDRKVLITIITRFDGGPVGLDAVAQVTGEESNTIADVSEPYLMRLGFLDRSPNGRIATARAYEHFGLRATDKAERNKLL